MRWLAGYRQERFSVGPTVERLLAAFAIPRPLIAGASWCGSSTEVLPVLFHLMWHHQLVTELSTPLSDSAMVGTQ